MTFSAQPAPLWRTASNRASLVQHGRQRGDLFDVSGHRGRAPAPTTIRSNARSTRSVRWVPGGGNHGLRITAVIDADPAHLRIGKGVKLRIVDLGESSYRITEFVIKQTCWGGSQAVPTRRNSGSQTRLSSAPESAVQSSKNTSTAMPIRMSFSDTPTILVMSRTSGSSSSSTNATM